jgi:hypothetical protein
MKAAIKSLVAAPLRFAIKQVLQRPQLKKVARALLIRAPRLNALLMRLMFIAPASTRRRKALPRDGLSPQAQRVERALRQAIRSRKH